MVKHLYIELDEDTHLKLKAKAYSQGKTISQIVKKLIEQYVSGEIN
jgi:predicted DNA-binding protein